MIADLVKESRMAKGYTQKELAGLSNISIRSIQRIENGEIMPRSYTLKTLAGILDRPFDEFARILQQEQETLSAENGTTPHKKSIAGLSKSQRIILSAGSCIIIVLLAWAYTAQSSRFPETTFELLIFLAIIVLILSVNLFLFWRNK